MSKKQVHRTTAERAAYWYARMASLPASAIVNAIGARSAALATTLDAFNERERAYGAREELGKGPRPLLPPTPSQAADMRLNGAVVPFGFGLGNGEIDKNQLGNWIRNNICN
jgi:hypothetical protein